MLRPEGGATEEKEEEDDTKTEGKEDTTDTSKIQEAPKEAAKDSKDGEKSRSQEKEIGRAHV